MLSLVFLSDKLEKFDRSPVTGNGQLGGISNQAVWLQGRETPRRNVSCGLKWLLRSTESKARDQRNELDGEANKHDATLHSVSRDTLNHARVSPCTLHRKYRFWGCRCSEEEASWKRVVIK